MARADVAAKLAERIQLGQEIRETEVRSNEQFDDLESRRKKWSAYNLEYLQRAFDSTVIADEYGKLSSWGALYFNATFNQEISSYRDGVQNHITYLEALLERLELIPELNPTGLSVPTASFDGSSNKVFVVHGHDDAAKVSVARFIERLGLEAVILHEQPNKGQTIIEKFEANAAGVSFAVVLLTPDDIGAPKDEPENPHPRARQNVILELGYFCGALGRERVCVLYRDGVEIPNDYLGVVYTPLDNSAGWHLKLAKEMKAAGLDIDLNLAM
ncbi:MAG: nucleotide-binding protein [Proteobacteria bacterium]|nr:nucleotide-binding protein [Pseudomonadota bacterium]